jgi:protein phosphatase
MAADSREDRFALAAGSETDQVRQGNEDSAYAGRWLYAIADRMGGHAAGEVASGAVIGHSALMMRT